VPESHEVPTLSDAAGVVTPNRAAPGSPLRRRRGPESWATTGALTYAADQEPSRAARTELLVDPPPTKSFVSAISVT
jgi:hypothetical protein